MISVIIPVHNGAPFLRAAIDSILAQTHPPGEILVVDDGSTDGSEKVAEAFGGRVRLFRQSHLGGSAALNHGLREAQGDLLAFLDADDMWSPTKLARQKAVLTGDSRVDAVFGGVATFVDPKAAIASPEGLPVSPAIRPGISKGAMLIRRPAFDRVGEFSSGVAVADFPDWYGRALREPLRFAEVDEVVLFRRIHDNNTTRNRSQMLHGDYLRIARESIARARTKKPSDTAQG